MPEEFVTHALECNVEFGGGNPAFLNDKLGTQRYLERDVPLEDACDWCASGCLGYHLNSMEHLGGGHNLSQLKIFEVTLHDGFDPRTGKQLGLHTGDPRNFKTLEELMEAYYKQVDYFTEKLHMFKMISLSTEVADGPMSGLRCAMQYETSIKSGLTPKEGGAKYPEGRTSWLGSRGMVDLAEIGRAHV